MARKIHTNPLKHHAKNESTKMVAAEKYSARKTIKRTTQRQDNDVNKAYQAVHDRTVSFWHNYTFF